MCRLGAPLSGSGARDMAQQSSEENRTEEATPHKLRKARERAQVARGNDLGFAAILIASLLLMLIFGSHLKNLLVGAMSQAFGVVSRADGSLEPTAILLAQLIGPTIQAILLVGVGAALVSIVFEIVQLRGLLFSTHPLKPDFSRLNPLQGLKRLFSIRTLKETLKNIAKFALYSGFGGLAIFMFISGGRLQISGAELGSAMHSGLLLLLSCFIALSLFVAAVDQIIARTEFAKEMRMSRSELDREHKEHEGDPRQKRKRRQLHAEYVKQLKQMEGLPGSDMLIVNPEHVAVALAYDPSIMEAPRILALGRNHFALMLKKKAAILGIPIIQDTGLARALHAGAETGQTIRQEQFYPVAQHYLRLRAQGAQVEQMHAQ